MWVYRKTKQEDGSWLYTVGYYYTHHAPSFTNPGCWEAIEDFPLEESARRLVNYLNGGER